MATQTKIYHNYISMLFMTLLLTLGSIGTTYAWHGGGGGHGWHGGGHGWHGGGHGWHGGWHRGGGWRGGWGGWGPGVGWYGGGVYIGPGYGYAYPIRNCVWIRAHYNRRGYFIPGHRAC